MTRVGEEIIPAFNSDALTVNGYLGTDGIKPLLELCNRYDKGIFVLAKTSNPSSGEFQDRLIDGEPLYLHMGKMCEAWGEQVYGRYGYSGVGAVVGATYPEQLAKLRAKLPHTFFLVPGYGAQGGTAEDVQHAFEKYGRGAIVNASRSIMCAWQKTGKDGMDYQDAARAAAEAMRDDIRQFVTIL